MRRFLRYFHVGDRTVKIHILEWRKKDWLDALDSGLPYTEPQYLFMDYDKHNPLEEAEEIVNKYKLRRGLIVESSPSRYHFLSFSPLLISTIAEIMFYSSCDKRHAQQLLRRGCVGIRVVPKSDCKAIPKIIHVINNQDGENFYNLGYETIYRSMLEEAKSNEKKRLSITRPVAKDGLHRIYT
jgi:hypothetical protein